MHSCIREASIPFHSLTKNPLPTHSRRNQMGLASKVEDMKALDAEARKRELEGLVAKQAEQKQAEARRLQEQAKRCVPD